MSSDVSDTSTEDWTVVNSSGAAQMETSSQTTISSSSDISVEHEADNLVNAAIDDLTVSEKKTFRGRVHSETHESVGSCCSEFTRLSSASNSGSDLSSAGDEQKGEASACASGKEVDCVGEVGIDNISQPEKAPSNIDLEAHACASPDPVMMNQSKPDDPLVKDQLPDRRRIEEVDDSDDDELSIVNLIGDSCSAGSVVEIDEYAMRVAASAGYPLHVGHPKPGLKIRRLSSTAGSALTGIARRKESDESNRDDSLDESDEAINEEELFSEELPVNWVQQCSNSIHNYIHTCNPPLNWKLTTSCILVTVLVVGLGLGHFLGTTTWLRLRRGNRTLITSLDIQADSYVACRREAEMAEIEKRRTIEKLQAKVAKCEFDKRHDNLDYCDKYECQTRNDNCGCKAPTPPPHRREKGDRPHSMGEVDAGGANLQSILYAQAQLHFANQHATQLLNVSKTLLTRLDALESKESQMLQSESKLKKLITDLQQTVDSLNLKIESQQSLERTLHSQLSECKNAKSPSLDASSQEDSAAPSNPKAGTQPEITRSYVQPAASDSELHRSTGQAKDGEDESDWSNLWKKFNSMKQDFNGTELLNAYLAILESVQLPDMEQLRQSPAWDTAESTLTELGKRVGSLTELLKHSLTHATSEPKVDSEPDDKGSTHAPQSSESDFLGAAGRSLLDILANAEAVVKSQTEEKKETFSNLFNSLSEEWPSLKSIIAEKQSYVNEQLSNLMGGKLDDEHATVDEIEGAIDETGPKSLYDVADDIGREAEGEEVLDAVSADIFRVEIKHFRDHLKRCAYAEHYRKEVVDDYIGKLKSIQKIESFSKTSAAYWNCQKWWWNSSPPFCASSSLKITSQCTHCWPHLELWQKDGIRSKQGLLSSNDKINKLVKSWKVTVDDTEKKDDQWMEKRAAGRQAIREEERHTDWIFERDRGREASRDKAKLADWAFERDHVREANRGKSRKSDWVFERSTGRAAVRNSVRRGKTGDENIDKHDDDDEDDNENSDNYNYENYHDTDYMNFHGDGVRRKTHAKYSEFRQHDKNVNYDDKYDHRHYSEDKSSKRQHYCGNKDTSGGRSRNRFMQWAKQKWQRLKDWTTWDKQKRKQRDTHFFGQQYDEPCH